MTRGDKQSDLFMCDEFEQLSDGVKKRGKFETSKAQRHKKKICHSLNR